MRHARFVSLQIAGLVLVALLVTARPLPVAAEAIVMDGLRFDVRMPAGYCALSRTHPKEKQHYERQDRLQSEINRVLLLAVPCGDVELVRSNKPWVSWIMWLLNGPPGRPTQIPAAMSRADVAAELAKGLPTIPPGVVDKLVDDAASKEGLSIKLRQTSILERDDTALYTAQTANVAANRDIAVVTGWLALGGHLLTLNTYTGYESAKTFQGLLKVTKAVIRSTAAASP